MTGASARASVVAVAVAVAMAWPQPAAAQSDRLPPCGQVVFDGRYCLLTLEGWTVYLSTAVKQRQSFARDVLYTLDTQLRAIVETLTAQRIQELKRVPIWVESDTSLGHRSHYHSAGSTWPSSHGFPVAKVGSVDIDADNLVKTQKSQPWAVLHELAHAYHDQVLGYGNEVVDAAYKHAVATGLYKFVRRNDNSFGQAYALTDVHEYFAELTEAYFGENDFFPFVRKQLSEYDPVGYEMIRSLWQDREPAVERRVPVAAGAGNRCSSENSIRSLAGKERTQIVFRNASSQSITVFWLDYQGSRKSIGQVEPGSLRAQRTYLSHPWLLTDEQGRCMEIVLPDLHGTWVGVEMDQRAP